MKHENKTVKENLAVVIKGGFVPILVRDAFDSLFLCGIIKEAELSEFGVDGFVSGLFPKNLLDTIGNSRILII